MIDISVIPSETFTIRIILKLIRLNKSDLNAIGMNQELNKAILCTLRFHHNMFLIHVFGCYLCRTAHIEKKPRNVPAA